MSATIRVLVQLAHPNQPIHIFDSHNFVFHLITHQNTILHYNIIHT